MENINDLLNKDDKVKIHKPKNKGGRPRKDPSLKSTHQVFVNFTESEKQAIQNYSDNMGISLSAAIKVSLKQANII